MHDIWNPWHGCTKVSEGCANCYMYSMDKARGLDGSVVRRNKSIFDYPLQRHRDGSFKVRTGEFIRICMTSDFLVKEADPWRAEAWDIIRQRPDVRFFILTKRPERFAESLPPDWGDGWNNVMLNVTCENQRRADERIPILLATPAKHKGIMCAPFIGAIDIERYLEVGERTVEERERDIRGSGIEQVICGGENYEGARPCDFNWVRSLYDQCVSHGVSFTFIETGSVFVKDGRVYHLKSKGLQSQQAFKSGMRYVGRPIKWNLTYPLGLAVPRSEWKVPYFRSSCATCGSLTICNGCSNCGQCGSVVQQLYTLEELFGTEQQARHSIVWDTSSERIDSKELPLDLRYSSPRRKEAAQSFHSQGFVAS